MARKLKVFRTPIGFHDAYVAASSRKAALAAWGSDKDLFARGAAEEVTDPALTKEPLAAPGTVVRKLRGTAEEQLASGSKPAGKRAAKAKPKPRRDALDAAETALAAAEAAHEAAERKLADEARQLARELEALRKANAAEATKLERARAAAARKYEAALERWRSG